MTTLIQAARRSMAMALFATLALLGGCSTAPPEGITPVTPFDVSRYVGKWYEIARLDHSFERGMTDVTATYRALPDGAIEVINRGFDPAKSGWRDATGKALFTGDPGRGSLKVSFFGPFYGGYHIVALDQQGYQWAMVAGPDRSYLWILARERKLPAGVREQLITQARGLGFDVDKLIWVSQDKTDS